ECTVLAAATRRTVRFSGALARHRPRDMNEFLTGFFDRGFLGNPLLRWVAAVLLALLVAFTLRILNGMTSRRLTRFAAQTEGAVIDDVIASVLSATTGLFIVLVAVYAGSKLLVLPGRSEELLRAALVIVAFMQAAL